MVRTANFIKSPSRTADRKNRRGKRAQFLSALVSSFSNRASLSRLGLMLALSFQTQIVSAADIVWDGTGDGTLLSNASNWVGDALPSTNAPDSMVFNGTVGGALALAYDSGLFGTTGNVGLNLSLTGAQTGSVTIAGSSPIQAIRLNNIDVASGAGALTLGGGSLQVALGGTTGVANVWTNNSSNSATLGSDVTFSSADGATRALQFAGSGNWVVNSNLNAGAANLAVFKTGTGELTLSGGGTLNQGGGVNAFGGTFAGVFKEGTTRITSGAYTTTGGEFVVGGLDAVGTNTQLIMDGGSISGGSWFSLGRGNGIGATSSTVVLNGTSSISTTNASFGFNAGNGATAPKGSLTLNDTSSFTTTTGQMLVGESANSDMSVIVNGGTLSVENDLVVGHTGKGSLELNSGTVNVASTTTRWMMLGRSTTGSGNLDVNGGNLNLNANTDLRMGVFGGAAGTNIANLDGGAITSYSGNQTGDGAGFLNMSGSNTSNSTFNLNGGTLAMRGIVTANDTGTAVFNFNGGTLRATGNEVNFINLGGAAQSANVLAGGAIINTNGYNVTVVEGLKSAGSDGGLTKNGAGVLTLSGTNLYSGATTVNAGTLSVTGSIANTVATTVNSGSTLTGTGSVGGLTSISSGGTVANTDGTNSLTLNAMSITSGTINAVLNGGSAGIDVTNNLTATGTTVVNASNVAWVNGVNNIVSYGSLTGSLSNFIVGTMSGLTSRQSVGSLQLASNNLAITIVGDTPVWTGLDSSSWVEGSTGANSNWKLLTGGTATDYIDGDVVLFNDSATGTTTVDIDSSDLTLTSMTFNNNSLNYTLNGSSGGVSSGLLNKSGSGTLTINATSFFTGGTTFSGGTLNLGNANALGSGGVTIAAGGAKTLDNTSGGAMTMALGGPLNFNDDFTFAGTNNLNLGGSAVTLGGTGDRTVTVNAGTLEVSRFSTGTTNLIKEGSGRLQLGSGGITTLGGKLAVNGGTVGIGINDLIVTGLTGSGTIDNNSGTTRWMFVDSNANETFSGTLTDGTGGGLLGFVKRGSGTLTLSGNNNYSDRTRVEGTGTLDIAGTYTGATFMEVDNDSTLRVSGMVTSTYDVSLLNNGRVEIANDTAFAAGSRLRSFSTGAKIRFSIDTAGNSPTLTMGTGNAVTIESNRATAGAGITHNLTTTEADGLGGGTINIVSGANVTSGSGNISFNNLNLAAGSVQTTLLNPTTATVTIGGVKKSLNAPNQTLGLGGTSTGNAVTGVIENGATGALIAVAKSNTSSWTLSGANTYTGGTAVNGGTLAIAGAGTLGATTNTLAMGGGHLDLGGTSQTAGAATITAAPGAGNTISNGTLTVDSLIASHTTGDAIVSAAIGGVGSVSNTGAGTLTLSGTNTFTGGTSATAGTVVLGSSGAVASGSLTVNNAVAKVADTLTATAVDIGTLTLTGTGALNMNRGGAVLNGTTLAAVRAQIAAGRTGGTWTGAGINSSYATTQNALAANSRSVGYRLGGSTFMGVTSSASDVLVRTVRTGDLNLDGNVNVVDRSVFSTNFGTTVTGDWFEGDLNYDGNINIVDRSLFSANFGQPLDGGVLNDAILGNGIPNFDYNPVTGEVTVTTDGSVFALILIDSAEANFLSTVSDPDGALGATWNPAVYSGGMNWSTVSFANTAFLTQGTWTLGFMAAGLTAADFATTNGDNVFYADNNGASNVTNINILNVVAVPEPSSVALIGLAGVYFLAQRRRRA